MGSLLVEYTLRYRWHFLAGAVLQLVATLLGLTVPWLLRQAIDLFSGLPHLGWTLEGYAGAIVGISLLEALCRFGPRLIITGASRRVEYDLRNRYFAHLETLEPAFFQSNRTGDLVARATNDLSAVRQLFGPALSNVLNTVLMFGLALALMFQISSTLAWWAALIMPITMGLFVLTRTRIHDRFTRLQEQFAAMADHAQETLAGERVVKAYAQEDHETETFRRTSQEYVARQLAQTRVTAILWPSMTLTVGLLTAVLLYAGGREVVEGRLTLGELVQFNAYVGMLAWPMIALGWVATLWQQGRASLLRLHEVLSRQSRVEDRPAPAWTPGPGAVELRNVSLTVDGTEILRDVSLAIPAGATIGIVGSLGSGKSTLVGLLPRLYDVTEGQVLIDGVDVRDIPLRDLRKQIGYVPQETFLFSGPIRENVTFGLDDTEITETRVRDALRLSQLENDLDQWPAGIDTPIGERGVTLSGGQKQRTSIARAVAKDPTVLVLDDALSSVDARTEEAILAGLRDFMRDRTSLVIAHRLSTIRDADRTVVMDGGRIVEEGTHAELVQHGGFYTRMYRRQLLALELGVEDDPPRSPERSDGGVPAGPLARRSSRPGGWGESS